MTQQSHNTLELEYTRCPECKALIAKTRENPNGKCTFRLCKNFGYDSKIPMKATDYIGKSNFVVNLGDVLHCIDIIEGNKLCCLTVGYPTALLLSEEEFKNAMLTQTLAFQNSNNQEETKNEPRLSS